MATSHSSLNMSPSFLSPFLTQPSIHSFSLGYSPPTLRSLCPDHPCIAVETIFTRRKKTHSQINTHPRRELSHQPAPLLSPVSNTAPSLRSLVTAESEPASFHSCSHPHSFPLPFSIFQCPPSLSLPLALLRRNKYFSHK